MSGILLSRKILLENPRIIIIIIILILAARILVVDSAVLSIVKERFLIISSVIFTLNLGSTALSKEMNLESRMPPGNFFLIKLCEFREG